jgi:intein-encoded DNA endonuclease-like protein
MTIQERLSLNKDYIIKSYQEGISTNKLAKEFNCNSGSIYFFLKNCNISIKQKQNFIGNIEDYKDKILQYFDDGLSAYKISKLLKINKTSILHFLQKHNCNTSRYNCIKENKLKDKKEQVIQLYREGKSCNEIAEIINHSQPEIAKLLKNNNIKLRPKNIYTVDETFFQNINSEEKAYILGLWYSDGNVKNNLIRISLQEDDIEILEKVKNILKYTGPLKLKIKKGNRKKQVELAITRKCLADQLINLGCVPNKSLILTFPDFLSEELIQHFIRGYFDGDGSINIKKEKNCSISITSTDMFNNVLEKLLLTQFQIKSKQYYRYKNTCTTSLMIGKTRNSLNFLNWIYSNSTIHLNRKYQKYLALKGYLA